MAGKRRTAATTRRGQRRRRQRIPLGGTPCRNGPTAAGGGRGGEKGGRQLVLASEPAWRRERPPRMDHEGNCRSVFRRNRRRRWTWNEGLTRSDIGNSLKSCTRQEHVCGRILCIFIVTCLSSRDGSSIHMYFLRLLLLFLKDAGGASRCDIGQPSARWRPRPSHRQARAAYDSSRPADTLYATPVVLKPPSAHPPSSSLLRPALSTSSLRLAMEDHVPGASGPSRAAASAGSGESAAGGSSAGAASSAGPSAGGGGSKSTAGAVGPPSAINTVALPPKPQFPALSGKALPVRWCGWNPVGIWSSFISFFDWSTCCSSLVCTVSDIVFHAVASRCYSTFVCWPLSTLSVSALFYYLNYSAAVRAFARSPSPPTATPHCRPSGCPSMSRWYSSSSCRCG